MQSIGKHTISIPMKGRFQHINADGEVCMKDVPAEMHFTNDPQGGVRDTVGGSPPAVNSDTLRYYVRAKLREFFEDETDINRLETAVFNKTLDISYFRKQNCNWKNIPFRNLYKQTYINLHVNLTQPKCEGLLTKIAMGDVKIEEVPYLTPLESCPELWDDIIQKQCEAAALQDQQFNQAATNSIFKCSRCKSRKVYHYQMQTRSADESMTVYCTCTECKKVWKIN